MVGNTASSAHQAKAQTDRQNKYAQVMRQATLAKQSRQNLESDDWMWRRNATPPPTNAE